MSTAAPATPARPPVVCRQYIAGSCRYGTKCRYIHTDDEGVIAEFNKKGKEISSVCKYGTGCRDPDKCTNLHLVSLPEPAPSAPAADAKVNRGPRRRGGRGRERKNDGHSELLRKICRAARRYSALEEAARTLASSAKTFKDPSLLEKAESLHRRMAGLERPCDELLKAIEDCFGPEVPPPAATESTDDDAPADPSA